MIIQCRYFHYNLNITVTLAPGCEFSLPNAPNIYGTKLDEGHFFFKTLSKINFRVYLNSALLCEK